MGETLEVFIDFNSAQCFLCLPLLRTIVRDYDVKVKFLPHQSSEKSYANVSEYNKRMKEYRRFDNRRYAKLLGWELIENSYSIKTRLALCGLLWANQKGWTESFKYCEKAFKHAWMKEHGKVVPTFDAQTVEDLLLSCGLSIQGFDEFQRNVPDWRLLDGPYKSIVAVPCFRYNLDKILHNRYSIPFIRYYFHSKGMQRNSQVIPDITLAYRFPEPVISPNIFGMPGTGLNSKLKRYRERSHNQNYLRHNAKIIDVYIDIKSPHAYLAIEMSRALEEDFNVTVDFLPFDFNITGVFGESVKESVKNPGTMESANEHKIDENNQRNPDQLKIVKSLYADCRYLANFQKTKIMGSLKVFDSTLALIALLWAKKCGRKYLDLFLDAIYPLMWRREMDIEDYKELVMLMVSLGIPLKHDIYGSFSDFTSGRGRKELIDIQVRAEKRGVLGVPSYLMEGEVYFGKEHLSLIRLKLESEGLQIANPIVKNVVDVPYLWRPSFVEGSRL